MKPKKLALVGCGYLGNIIARAYTDGLLEGYELVGVMSRTRESAQKTAVLAGCKACDTIEELLKLRPDYVAEAASVKTVRDLALKVLGGGAHLVVLSIGAFADAEFYEQVKAAALENGTQVHLASGAIGGFDVLQTISLMAQAEGYSEQAGISTRKGPESLRNTPVFQEELIKARRESTVFDGCAKDAIALFPTKVNVAVATALATTGPQITGVKITSVPGFLGDDHQITAEIKGVKAVVDIYSSTSAIAGWSVVALLRNLISPIAFQ